MLKINIGLYQIDRQSGAIVIEFTVAMVLLAAIVFGLGTQLLTELREYDHYARATEIMMGPQEKSLVYSGGVAAPLSDSTTPTLENYMDTIGNFYKMRTADNVSGLFLLLAYIPIDPDQGTIGTISNATTFSIYKYYSNGGGDCANNEAEASIWLYRYTNGKFDQIRQYASTQVPADVDDDKGRFGVKLFDIDQAGTRTRGYEEVLPILFAVLCSDVETFGLRQQVLTYHTIVPRRHGS